MDFEFTEDQNLLAEAVQKFMATRYGTEQRRAVLKAARRLEPRRVERAHRDRPRGVARCRPSRAASAAVPSRRCWR